MVQDDKRFLLRIPQGLHRELEQVIGELGRTRTAFILESIRRNLHFTTKAELPALRRVKVDAYH